MSPSFFIDRPIFAAVLSIIIVVVGLVSLEALPIAQFPEITPPVVQIEADYPGASAEVIADSVARPIEVQLPGIDNLLYYSSTSTNDGHMTIQLTFEIGTTWILRRSRPRTAKSWRNRRSRTRSFAKASR